jgi:hypothetical protein
VAGWWTALRGRREKASFSGTAAGRERRHMLRAETRTRTHASSVQNPSINGRFWRMARRRVVALGSKRVRSRPDTRPPAETKTGQLLHYTVVVGQGRYHSPAELARRRAQQGINVLNESVTDQESNRQRFTGLQGAKGHSCPAEAMVARAPARSQFTLLPLALCSQLCSLLL